MCGLSLISVSYIELWNDENMVPSLKG